MVGAVSVRPELKKSSTKRDQNFKALRFWKRVLLGLWGVFSEYTSSLEWRCSYRRLTKKHLVLSYTFQSRSSFWPQLILPQVHLKNASPLLLWWTSGCEARVSKTGMSVSLHRPSLFPPFHLSVNVMCSKSTIQSHLSLAPCFPFIHDSWYCFSHSSVGGHQVANSGQAGRWPSSI